MSQLLDRYRRVSDGKEFAVISLGAFSAGTSAPAMTLEAEDGERVERPASAARGTGVQGAGAQGIGRFERIED